MTTTPLLQLMGCWFNSRLNGTVGLLAVPRNPGQPETGSMDASSFLPTKCADSLSPNICETSNLYTRVMKCCRRTVMKFLPTRTHWISCSSCKILNVGRGPNGHPSISFIYLQTRSSLFLMACNFKTPIALAQLWPPELSYCYRSP